MSSRSGFPGITEFVEAVGDVLRILSEVFPADVEAAGNLMEETWTLMHEHGLCSCWRPPHQLVMALLGLAAGIAAAVGSVALESPPRPMQPLH